MRPSGTRTQSPTLNFFLTVTFLTETLWYLRRGRPIGGAAVDEHVLSAKLDWLPASGDCNLAHSASRKLMGCAPPLSSLVPTSASPPRSSMIVRK